MADATSPSNGASANAPVGEPQVRVLTQFIKDLSFENPNMGKELVKPGEQPDVKVEVNVNAQRLGADTFQSTISLKAECSASGGVLYDLEIEYGGIYQARYLPEQALEPFLLVNCPTLTFPFLRRIVADITREGGFPPLLLDPLDFAALYMQRRGQQSGAPATA